MSVWNKITDFLTTLNSGGIVRSISSMFDPDNWLPGGKDAAFTLALVALMAKMAAADGIVTNSEIATFKSIVKIPKESEKQIDRIFDLAQQDVAGYQSYAKKIARLFSDNPKTLERVLESLFEIASADGMIHEDELIYLKNISDIFGFSEVKFEQISSIFIVENSEIDPYMVLGLSADVSDENLKKTYKKLLQEHHPDKMMANNIPKEMLALTNAKMSAINVAYKSLKKIRNL